LEDVEITKEKCKTSKIIILLKNYNYREKGKNRDHELYTYILMKNHK
jgi:hypothetical protein